MGSIVMLVRGLATLAITFGLTIAPHTFGIRLRMDDLRTKKSERGFEGHLGTPLNV